MKCPECSGWSHVLYTKGTYRRRECANGHRFNTHEVVDHVNRQGGDRRSLMFNTRKLQDAKKIRIDV